MWPSPLLALLLLLRMLLPLQVHGLAFSPTNHGDRLWDTWLYRNTDPTVPQTWILNYLVKHDEPIITHGAQGWNAANTAVSTDGVHFSDVGLAIQRPCDCQDETARHTCLTNMGSSSIWRSLTNSSEFIMAYGANVSDPAVPAGQNCGVLRNASDQTSADRNASGIYTSTGRRPGIWRERVTVPTRAWSWRLHRRPPTPCEQRPTRGLLRLLHGLPSGAGGDLWPASPQLLGCRPWHGDLPLLRLWAR